MKKIIITIVILSIFSCIPDSRELVDEEIIIGSNLEADLQSGTEEWFENNLDFKYPYQKEFINQIALPSYNEETRTGMKMEVMMAQAILESGWGRSKLAKEHNNFFGIKEYRKGKKGAKLATNEYVKGKKVRVKAKFRKYNSPKDCFADRSEWFLNNYRYDDLDFKTVDWVDLTIELQERGYATDPDYSIRLIRIVKKYKLDKYSKWVRKEI